MILTLTKFCKVYFGYNLNSPFIFLSKRKKKQPCCALMVIGRSLFFSFKTSYGGTLHHIIN